MTLKIDFNALRSIKDWTDALDKIRGAASLAIQQMNSAAGTDLQKLLVMFVDKHPAKVADLVPIANQINDDLTLAFNQQDIQDIAAHNPEVTRATGGLKDVTAEANEDADGLLLAKPQEILDKIKEFIPGKPGVAQAGG